MIEELIREKKAMKYTMKGLQFSYESTGAEKVACGVDEINVEFAANEYLEATKAICVLAKDILSALKEQAAKQAADRKDERMEEKKRAVREWERRHEKDVLHKDI